MKVRKTDVCILWNGKHYLRKRSDGTYKVLSESAYIRVGTMNETKFVDLDGGPMLSVGDNIGAGTIKDIYTKKGTGVIIELE